MGVGSSAHRRTGLGVVAVRGSEHLVLRLGSQPDRGFARVLTYADLPQVRA
jgi:hypothetical protein